jgi:hypothetical protein
LRITANYESKNFMSKSPKSKLNLTVVDISPVRISYRRCMNNSVEKPKVNIKIEKQKDKKEEDCRRYPHLTENRGKQGE